MATNQQAQQVKQVDPAVRAAMFAQMTRQHIRSMPSESANAGETITFTLPKVRLLSKIWLLVTATVKVTHASASTFQPHPFAPWNLLRRVSVDANNGFSPLVVSGRDLYFYNLVLHDPRTLTRQTSGRGRVVMTNQAGSSGATNTIRFLAELPITLNDRDPVGLILLQNEETVVTVTVDVGDPAQLLAAEQTGYTVTLENLTVTPVVESFSIPAVPDAFPDISVLKLVQSTTESIAGAGQHVMKLPVGTTYRKLLLYIEDANGNGVADSALNGDIEIIFNQADIPYSIPPVVLAGINAAQFGTTFPDGLYVFDLSYQGLPNYGGARDYIDTERLTEFWVRFGAPSAGKVTAVYETLSRLRAQ